MKTGPHISDAENAPIMGRPLPDTLRQVEAFFTAVNESRVSIETTIKTQGGEFVVTNRIVVKES